MAGKLHHGNLHTQTDPQVGNLLLPGVLGGQNHPLDSPASKSAGNQDPIQPVQLRGNRSSGQSLRVDPPDIYPGIQGIPRVAQGLGY